MLISAFYADQANYKNRAFNAYHQVNAVLCLSARLMVEASFKTLVFRAHDFSFAPTFQITLIGNSFTQSFRILIGYIAFKTLVFG